MSWYKTSLFIKFDFTWKILNTKKKFGYQITYFSFTKKIYYI